MPPYRITGRPDAVPSVSALCGPDIGFPRLDGDQIFAVDEATGDTVGFVIVDAEDPSRPHVNLLCVGPGHRNSGVGALLWATMERHVLMGASSPVRFGLETGARAVPFWSSVGFVASKVVLGNVWMYKQVNDPGEYAERLARGGLGLYDRKYMFRDVENWERLARQLGPSDQALLGIPERHRTKKRKRLVKRRHS